MDSEKRTTSILLALGVTLPIVYFGMQLAAAPFCADYSFVRRDASTLGSAECTRPWIFNGGSFLLGVIMIAASAGFWEALVRLGVRTWLATATAITIAMGGLGSINAALFPLPDPRHTGGVLALVGSVLLLAPLALTVAVWRLAGFRWFARLFDRQSRGDGGSRPDYGGIDPEVGGACERATAPLPGVLEYFSRPLAARGGGGRFPANRRQRLLAAAEAKPGG